jgi:hypothetical protein
VRVVETKRQRLRSAAVVAPRRLQESVKGRAELARIDRLAKKSVGARTHGFVRVIAAGVHSRHGANLNVSSGRRRAKPTADFEAVDVGKMEIQENDRRLFERRQFERLRSIARGRDGEAVTLDEQREDVPRVPMIVDDENRSHGGILHSTGDERVFLSGKTFPVWWADIACASQLVRNTLAATQTFAGEGE